jgi:hypothetical protein
MVCISLNIFKIPSATRGWFFAVSAPIFNHSSFVETSMLVNVAFVMALVDQC